MGEHENATDLASILGSTSVDEDGGDFSNNEGMVNIFVLNYVIFGSAVGLFGMATNVINLIIFLKQGLNNTINISLFALAVSDLFSLTALQWLNICNNPYFENAGFPFVPSEIKYLTAGWPQAYFARTGTWITVYITAERCLCIIAPLKVKQIVTPRKTIFIICTIYVVLLLTVIPVYATSYFDWKFYPSINETRLGLIFTDRTYDTLVFFINLVLALMAWFAMVFLTILLHYKLQKKTKWRKQAVSNSSQSESLSNRDKKTMAMIVLIASIFIICYIPGNACFTASVIEPEFSVLGKFADLFYNAWSFGFLFVAINSSVNIFLYYNMSTKYRQTFDSIFRKSQNDKKST